MLTTVGFWVHLKLFYRIVSSRILFSIYNVATSSYRDEKLEAAHQKLQRRLLGNRNHKVRNEVIRKKSGSWKLELIIKERRLRWLGHVLRIQDSRIPRQAIQWELRGYKRKPGRTRKNWMDIVRRDLKDMGTTWDEVEELATNRAEWRQRVSQCIHLHAGWTKVLT